MFLSYTGFGVFVFGFNIFGYYGHEVSDQNYALMPELFHLDNYDDCLMLDDPLYCTFTLELYYQDPDRQDVWNIIQNVTSDPRNYRHDLLRHGICVSTSCPNASQNIHDTSLKEVIENCYNRKYEGLGLKGNLLRLKCTDEHTSHPIDITDIIFAAFLIGYIVFLIFASIYEGVARYQKKEVYEKITRTVAGQLVVAFSLPKNWYRLRHVSDNPDAKKLRSIQGIRFYNMICVILCHTIMINFSGPVSNPQYTEKMTKNALNMFIANGNYAVQTFFLISGWLLCFHFFQSLDGKKKITMKFLLFVFVNRYIRLIPTLAMVLAFESTWFVKLGQGPLWDDIIGEEYKNCRKNWWTNMLFINNYVDRNNMCLQHTWYVASDTQLYIASLVILTFMWFYKPQIKAILATTITCGLFIQGAMAYIRNYDIIIRQYPEILYDLQGVKLDAWHDLYSSGYSNITGYAIGLTFGYIYYTYRNKAINIKRIHIILWWFLTFGMCIFVILIAAEMYEPNFKANRIGSAIYWALGKNLFALGIAIGIFGFTQKIGWFARWICEWSPMNILGRLTYSTYIVHLSLIRLRVAYQRNPFFANDYNLLVTTLGDIVFSYLIGTLACLMFEMPISALQKLMVPQMTVYRPKISSEKSLKTLEYDECDSVYAKQDVCTKV